MPTEICTQEQFIKLWNEHKSSAKIARILGINETAVKKRRRRIERNFGICLDAAFKAKETIKPSEGRVRLDIDDGVVIVFSDAHFCPGVDTTAFRALLSLIKQLKPVAIINNGDAFDGGTISRFPRIGWDNKPSVVDELKAVQRALDMVKDAAPKGCRLTWPLGNHDARFETFLASRVPEFQGVDGFHLKDRFPEWTPCWLTEINDDVIVKHRYKGGIHATHNNVLWSGKTMVTGHLHSLKVTPFSDYNGTRFGVDTGTLADPGGEHDRDYTECNPLNHRSGFVVLTFRDGVMLDPEIVRKWDEDTVVFRGHLINADTGLPE